ncbi:expressed protein [Phakopsora pachyrhizi]|uniref:Expressed protein n=1 Tax=Phakopsora pachyrhizi TaxID=170000 RepID=A0AAV0AWK4_PHAPC|nr:expressed protein [Phakopsora pachyrhizi]
MSSEWTECGIGFLDRLMGSAKSEAVNKKLMDRLTGEHEVIKNIDGTEVKIVKPAARIFDPRVNCFVHVMSDLPPQMIQADQRFEEVGSAEAITEPEPKKLLGFEPGVESKRNLESEPVQEQEINLEPETNKEIESKLKPKSNNEVEAEPKLKGEKGSDVKPSDEIKFAPGSNNEASADPKPESRKRKRVSEKVIQPRRSLRRSSLSSLDPTDRQIIKTGQETSEKTEDQEGNKRPKRLSLKRSAALANLDNSHPSPVRSESSFNIRAGKLRLSSCSNVSPIKDLQDNKNKKVVQPRRKSLRLSSVSSLSSSVKALRKTP